MMRRTRSRSPCARDADSRERKERQRELASASEIGSLWHFCGERKWSWAHGGNLVNGEIVFMKAGMLETSFGDGTGTWELLSFGRMCVTFGNCRHDLVLEHSVGENCQPIFLVQGRVMVNPTAVKRGNDPDTIGILQMESSINELLQPIGFWLLRVEPLPRRVEIPARLGDRRLASREEIGSLWDQSGHREWLWMHDGKKVNGRICFMEGGSLWTSFGTGAEEWSHLKYGRMRVTFGSCHHDLVLDHSCGDDCKPKFLVASRKLRDDSQNMRNNVSYTIGILERQGVSLAI